jgi:hypothetical protein
MERIATVEIPVSESRPKIPIRARAIAKCPYSSTLKVRMA